MTSPLDLTTESFEVYRLLYSKMDFDTFLVKYTLDQLAVDSNSKLLMTKKKVSTIINNFIDESLLTVVKKGSKGNATIYELTKISELNLGTQRELKGNSKETQEKRKGNLTSSNTSVSEGVEERKSNLKETQKELKGNSKVTPIIDKDIDKEKDKEIHTPEKEIFDYWNSKQGTIISQEKSFDKGKITTAIKKYKKEGIVEAIDRMNKALLDTDYFYSNRWNIYNFLKQANGITNWLNDGQYWNNYLEEKGNAKEGQAKLIREVKKFV